jgi:predicted Fe-S protein YdhL (DUF1289 family)
MTDKEVIARSPCLGDCNPNDEGICLSCFLSSNENDQWNHVSNQERLVMLENAHQRQQAKSEGRSMSETGTSTHD